MSDTVEQKREAAWLWPVLVVVCTALSYLNGVRGAMIFDDQVHIVDSAALRYWKPGDGFPSGRPVIFASLLLNYKLGGLNPAGYHLLNIAVHGIAALALYGIARRTFAGPVGRTNAEAQVLAFAIAAIWAVHPLQTESVTYIIQRCESMMGMFFLLAMYAFIRGATAAARGARVVWYAGSCLAFFLSTGCKEVALAFPLVAIAYDRMFLSVSWPQLLRQRGWVYLAYAPIAALLFLKLVPYLIANEALPETARGPSVGLAMEGMTPWMYLRSQPTVLLHYLALSVWPAELCLDYRLRSIDNPLQIYGLGLIVVALLLVTLWLCWRGNPLGWVGLSWFIILAPTSSFIPTADIEVEHRMYLPLAAVVTLVVVGIDWLCTRLGERRLAGVAGVAMVLVAALGARTVMRNRDYIDPLHMWQLVAAQRPLNDRAHLNSAILFEQRGQRDAARREYELAVQLGPGDPKNLYGYGKFLAATGNSQEAIKFYKAALDAWPGYVLAHLGQGNIAARDGRFADAVPHYRAALEVDPHHLQAKWSLADSLARSGGFQESIGLCREILEVVPDHVRAQATLAWSLALADDPALRDGRQAVELAKPLVQATQRRDVEALELLALAHAEAGQFSQAVAAAEAALDVAKEARQAKAEPRLAALIAAFRDRQAVHFQRHQELSKS